jgi:hypothetical protein
MGKMTSELLAEPVHYFAAILHYVQHVCRHHFHGQLHGEMNNKKGNFILGLQHEHRCNFCFE